MYEPQGASGNSVQRCNRQWGGVGSGDVGFVIHSGPKAEQEGQNQEGKKEGARVLEETVTIT